MYRTRLAESTVNTLSKMFGAVLVAGPRQVGKTTMLKKYPEGVVDAGDVGLPITRDNLVLPCGIYGRWEN